MEKLIFHFLNYSEGFPIRWSGYFGTECPKGELGVFLRPGICGNLPGRVRIRAPGFFALAGLDHFIKNQQLSDLVAILGSIDLVLGEVDR
jgi:NADH:ubiquinone oxidoreductase subunit D